MYTASFSKVKLLSQLAHPNGYQLLAKPQCVYRGFLIVNNSTMPVEINLFAKLAKQEPTTFNSKHASGELISHWNISAKTTRESA